MAPDTDVGCADLRTHSWALGLQSRLARARTLDRSPRRGPAARAVAGAGALHRARAILSTEPAGPQTSGRTTSPSPHPRCHASWPQHCEGRAVVINQLTDGETEARGQSLIRNTSQPRCAPACACPRRPPSPAHASVHASITLSESPQAPLPRDRVRSPADWPHRHLSKQNKASKKT